MDPNLKFDEDKGKVIDESRKYEDLWETYIFNVTRLDITFTVEMVHQYMQEPRQQHLEFACRILRYLKGAPKKA